MRGTTSDRIVRMLLREAGCHRGACPQFTAILMALYYFGTDIPAREQLIAYNRTNEDIRQIIGADSLGYPWN